MLPLFIPLASHPFTNCNTEYNYDHCIYYYAAAQRSPKNSMDNSSHPIRQHPRYSLRVLGLVTLGISFIINTIACNVFYYYVAHKLTSWAFVPVCSLFPISSCPILHRGPVLSLGIICMTSPYPLPSLPLPLTPLQLQLSPAFRF